MSEPFIEVVADSLGRGDVIEVRSTSDPTKTYRVDLKNGRCSCKAWINSQNGARTCKHLRGMKVPSWQGGRLKKVY